MESTKRFARGFSLIEIMIGLAIIGTMAALVMPNLLKYIGRGKETATKSGLATVKAALIDYNNDIGHFPTKAEGGINALVKMPKGDRYKKYWNGPYVEGSDLPLDGWKNDFIYNSPPVKLKNEFKFYEVYSTGDPSSGDDEKITLYVGA